MVISDVREEGWSSVMCVRKDDHQWFARKNDMWEEGWPSVMCMRKDGNQWYVWGRMIISGVCEKGWSCMRKDDYLRKDDHQWCVWGRMMVISGVCEERWSSVVCVKKDDHQWCVWGRITISDVCKVRWSLTSKYGMCRPLLGSWYFLANPKSMTWHTCCAKSRKRR